MILSLKTASFAANGKTLLGPISLDIPMDGITVVLGPNGAGKSLFLEMCHGLIPLSMGSLCWDGIPANHEKSSRGYIFQHRITLRQSVARNIALPLRAAKWPKAKQIARTKELLSLTQLSAKADEPAVVLSGGEAQRMALARAMAHHPKTILMDEPTSNLDPKATETFEMLIQDIADSGVSFLWATHNLAQAKRFAKHVLFISEGKIVEYAPADQFFNTPIHPTCQNFLRPPL
ncbi:ABC transporter ATP-binding protein [Amylibacter marinus]|uniref:ABC transporter ATP-binding protein n=1 Tax=Amylibacter marinus TaxID=1475483 RepID=A0ABQ5VTQ5_9RHOB|nr:ATP-binding cassette domain-containing protein [Amylibacter marinus]GLQ34547.1 ABC transporter ATP-binding protein [Amylibacter marinus]